MNACRKRVVRCGVELGGGGYVEATNLCDPPDGECARLEDDGSGYDRCRSTHAEANAAAMVPPWNIGGTAYVYGHTYICRECQEALMAVGVHHFVIVPEGEDDWP